MAPARASAELQEKDRLMPKARVRSTSRLPSHVNGRLMTGLHTLLTFKQHYFERLR